MARALGLSPDPSRTHVIHMGVDVPASAAAHAERAGSSGPHVLCPAQLYPVKGHQYLISALGILRDRGIPCSLWIAGEGHLLEELQRQAGALGLQESIRFLGAVPHERILEWYRAGSVDIVVLASVDLGRHEHEGIPVALMEAMALGIPTISTQTGGIPELLGNRAGILVPPEDPEALAAALGQLILDSHARGRIGRVGRAKVAQQFNVERTTAELAQLIMGRDPQVGIATVETGRDQAIIAGQ
jgi:colanic acid/amylovoran biosynthesis glycosyltransferase